MRRSEVDAAAVLLPVPVARGIEAAAPADLLGRRRGKWVARRRALRRLGQLLLRRAQRWNPEFGQSGVYFRPAARSGAIVEDADELGRTP